MCVTFGGLVLDSWAREMENYFSAVDSQEIDSFLLIKFYETVYVNICELETATVRRGSAEKEGRKMAPNRSG